MEVCCYNRNNCSRHSVIIMRVMNIQKAYKPKYQPFNRGGYVKHKRIYKTVDSIDIQVEVAPVEFDDISSETPAESSASIRERVVRARVIQAARFHGEQGVHCNAQMSSKMIRKYCHLDNTGLAILRDAMTRLNMSARAYDRILKVSRTIADLAGSEHILPAHVSEAVNYRNLDRTGWAK